jgi:hypothetical protein
MMEEEYLARQQQPVQEMPPPPVPDPAAKYQRFLVLEVTTTIKEGKNFERAKLLRLFDEKGNQEKYVTIAEDWYFTKVHTGDCILLVYCFRAYSFICKYSWRI